MPDEVGDFLVDRGVNVVQAYGGTEFSIASHLSRDRRRCDEDWAWIEIAPNVPLRWLEHTIGGETLYELQVLARINFA